MQADDDMTLNVDWFDEESIQALFLEFPLPLALIQSALGEAYLNRCFESRFSSNTLNSSELISFLENGEVTPLSIDIEHRDGGASRVDVHRVSLSNFTLLVFDDADDSGSNDEMDQMRLRLNELERISVTDPLTGAWNRLPLERNAELEMARCVRYQQPVSLVMFDVDHFKSINDRFGHSAGDEVLKQLVQLVKGQLRNTDMLFRWGGEEFVVLTPACTHRAASHLAEKLRASLEVYTFHDVGHATHDVGHATMSLGVAEYVPGEKLKDWLDRADKAVYEGKSKGRNQVVVDPNSGADIWFKDGNTSLIKLVWYEHFESGNKTIDAQHKLLFKLTNELIDLSMQDLPIEQWKPSLDRLFDYVVKHFEDEELILQMNGYKDLDAHKKMHATLIADANALKEDALRGVLPVGRLFEYVVYNVVARHVLGADRDYFSIFDKN